MKVLVVAASKHGATREVAEAIVRRLEIDGLEAEAHQPETVESLSGVGAVVIGSAVYAGHWMKSALGFAQRFSAELRAVPVWLFSSGPIGDPPLPTEDPVDVSKALEATGAREHRLIPGKLDRSKLSFPERAVVGALRVPDGDFRPWTDIDAWADEIASQLKAPHLAG